MSVYRCGCQRRAVLTCGREDQWQFHALRTFAEMESILEALGDDLAASGFPLLDRLAVRSGLEAAIENAITHGNHQAIDKLVLVRFCVTDLFLIAQVEDEGSGFNPVLVSERTGRGLALMQRYMTSVRYNPAGNCVTLCKHRTGGQSLDASSVAAAHR
jgi:serine/threonine-protein kinase RsbW